MNLGALLPLLPLASALAPDADAPPEATGADPIHRYLVARTFPPGALDGLDAATKAKVNANNASLGVRWVRSYANADRTKTYCVYEGADEAAIRDAATLNGLPVDSVVEIPVDLESCA